jgi:hypothetical protein
MRSRIARWGLGALAAGAWAGPALADHPTISGASRASGAISTISASTLPKGKTAVGLRATLMKPERLGDAELARRAGLHIHAHDSDYLLSSSLSAAYGVTEDFTLAFSLAHLRRQGLRAGVHAHGPGGAQNGVERLGSSAGLGDGVVLGQFRLLDLRAAGLQAAILGGVKLPTGRTRTADRKGNRFETEHQPGTGSWDPLFGLAISKAAGRVSIDASILYQASGKGAQRTTLGDRVQYGLGLAYRLGAGADHHDPAPAHSGDHAPGSDHDHAAPVPAHGHSAWDLVLELNGEWEGRQTVAGAVDPHSGGNIIYLSPGLRYSSKGGWAAALSLGLPVAQDVGASHPDTGFRATAALSWGF